MIFVTMGNEYAFDARSLIAKPSQIGIEQIDSQVIVGKARTAVHDENAIVLLDGEAVHPDLTEPS